MFGIQFSIKKAEDDQTASETQKSPIDPFFQVDDTEEPKEAPKMPIAKIAAKTSKNLGRFTATSGNNFYFPAGTIGTFHTKFHHSTRSIDRYVDKIGKKQLSVPVVEPERPKEEVEENPVIVKEREIKRLKEIIRGEQKKIKICMLCKRKFASQEQLKKHEELSEIHKRNVEKNQQQQRTNEGEEMEIDNENEFLVPEAKIDQGVIKNIEGK